MAGLAAADDNLMQQPAEVLVATTTIDAARCALMEAHTTREVAVAKGARADAAELAAAAAAAERMAAEEGLVLIPASTTGGYRGVKLDKHCASRPYNALIGKDGHTKSLGYFATAKEAALAYARAKKDATGVVPPQPFLTEHEADEYAAAAAASEGLELVPTESDGRFKGVKKHKCKRSRPYEAKIWMDGKTKSLGHYMTAREAALAYARAKAAGKSGGGEASSSAVLATTGKGEPRPGVLVAHAAPVEGMQAAIAAAMAVPSAPKGFQAGAIPIRSEGPQMGLACVTAVPVCLPGSDVSAGTGAAAAGEAASVVASVVAE